MPTKPKRQKRVPGDIVRINLSDGHHTYARVLPDASFAFYDSRVKEDLSVEAIIKLPILFQLGVMDYAVTRGFWPVVGNIPLEPELLIPLPKFIQDPLKPTSFSIYFDGEIKPAPRKQCEGLESCAVWDPEHVEDRLRDHFAGHPNNWVESLRIK